MYDFKNEKLLELYNLGEQIRDIAKLFNVSYTCIRMRLLKMNYNPRPPAGETHGNWKGGKSRWYSLKHHIPPTNDCQRCKLPNVIQRHHIDRNPHNNNISNIEFLCRSCHNIEHEVIRNITG